MSIHQRLLSCKPDSDSVFAILGLLLLTGVTAAQDTPARFEVIKVTDEIYVHRDNAHMNLFMITDDGIVVVDPMNPDAGSNLAQVLQRMAPDKKLLAIVYSHYHADHAGGARPLLDVYGDDVPIVANKRTGELLADKNWKSVVPPHKAYRSSLEHEGRQADTRNASCWAQSQFRYARGLGPRSKTRLHC